MPSDGDVAEMAGLVQENARLRAESAEKDARIARLVEAAESVRDDCLARAKFSADGKTVPIGDGAWIAPRPHRRGARLMEHGMVNDDTPVIKDRITVRYSTGEDVEYVRPLTPAGEVLTGALLVALGFAMGLLVGLLPVAWPLG